MVLVSLHGFPFRMGASTRLIYNGPVTCVGAQGSEFWNPFQKLGRKSLGNGPADPQQRVAAFVKCFITGGHFIKHFGFIRR